MSSEHQVKYNISHNDMRFVLSLIHQLNAEVEKGAAISRSVRWWALIMILLGLIRKGYPAGTQNVPGHFDEAVNTATSPAFQKVVEDALVGYANFYLKQKKEAEERKIVWNSHKNIVCFSKDNDYRRN